MDSGSSASSERLVNAIREGYGGGTAGRRRLGRGSIQRRAAGWAGLSRDPGPSLWKSREDGSKAAATGDQTDLCFGLWICDDAEGQAGWR